MSFTNEVASGSPTRLTTQTDSGTPFRRSNSRIADGTVLMSLTSLAAGNDGSAKAFSARITFPPQHSGTNISKTDRSKQIEVEASTPESSSGVNTSCAQLTNATALRCSMATPLGVPVEPEV